MAFIEMKMDLFFNIHRHNETQVNGIRRGLLKWSQWVIWSVIEIEQWEWFEAANLWKKNNSLLSIVHLLKRKCWAGIKLLKFKWLTHVMTRLNCNARRIMTINCRYELKVPLEVFQIFFTRKIFTLVVCGFFTAISIFTYRSTIWNRNLARNGKLRVFMTSWEAHHL